MNWKNYGDVNPIEHGGMFVKYDNEIKGRNYYVVHLTPFFDGTKKWALIDGYIDLNDSWIEWEDIKQTMDTPDGATDEYLATDVMHYYGVHCSNGEQEIFDDEIDVVERLKGMEIKFDESV